MNGITRAYHQIANSHDGFPGSFLHYEFDRYGLGWYWPSLVPSTYVLTLFLVTFKWFFILNLLYLAAIMLAIYYATRFFIGDIFYSVLAAVIFSSYWVTGLQLVSYEVQLAGTACIAWGFYWYLRSYSFTRFWPSVFVCLAMIVGVYSDRVGPGAYIFTLFFIPENFRNKRSVISMLLISVTVIVFAWPFYHGWVARNLFNPDARLIFFSQTDDTFSIREVYKVILQKPEFLAAHIAYYFISLTEVLLGYGFTGLLAGSLFFFNRLKLVQKKILWIAVLVPLAAFVLIVKKDHVYIFPLCVYFAMITAIGIYFIKNRIVRYVLIFIIMILSIGQHAFFLAPKKAYHGLLFSEQFPKMQGRGIPRLYIDPYPDVLMLSNTLSFITDQVSSYINHSSLSPIRKKVLIVDLDDGRLQQSLTALLNIKLLKIEVVNAFFMSEVMPEDCEADDLYLLSDKKIYAEGVTTSGRCSWSGTASRYRLPGTAITLYGLEKR